MSVARPAAVSSLLELLGGRDAIEIVVVGVWERMIVDPSLGALFRDVSRTRYERGLADSLCVLLDSDDPPWIGRELRRVHGALGVCDADFDRFLDCLAATLEAAGVSRPLVRRVRGRVAVLRGDIVSGAVAN